MDLRVAIWSVVLCTGLLVWLYFDVKSMHIDYEWHSFLVDEKTGQKFEPRELLDLKKIINITDDYINSTNSMERLFDLKYQTNIENPIALEQIYSSKQDLELSAWPIANQSQCSEQLDWINGKLEEHKDYQLLKGKLGAELTQLMDSFGKPETGLYSGTVTWMGSYRQCLKVSLNGGQIKMGRYCQARLRPKWWSKSARPATHINMGICLPETCDTMSFNELSAKIDSLIRVDLPAFYKDNLEFDSMFCLPDERSPLRQLPTSGRVYLFIVGTWLAVVVLASIQYELTKQKMRRRLKSYELVTGASRQDQHQDQIKIDIAPTKAQLFKLVQHDDTHDQKIESLSRECDLSASSSDDDFKFKLLEALSIHNSLKKFKSHSFRQNESHTAKRRVDLGCLDFFKSIFAILIVLGHGIYVTSLYIRSVGARVSMNLEKKYMVVASFGRCTDTFFLLFGLLLAYTMLRKFTPKQLANPATWTLVNVDISIRILPLYWLIYWFARSIAPYTGSGPWWDYGVYDYSMRGRCSDEPWWKSMPQLNLDSRVRCVPPGWFIVSYTQLALILPLLAYLMYKLPNNWCRQLLVAIGTAVSCSQLALKMYPQVSFKHEAFTLYGGFLLHLLEQFESTGTMATLGKVGTVSVGCFVGYLLRMYEIGTISEWPRWFSSRITSLIVILLHVLILMLPIIGSRLSESSGHIASMNEFLVFFLVFMIMWPILNAFMIINATTISNRTALVRFTSHSFWHIFNKLGLCIFLIHWELIMFGLTSYEQGPSMGFGTDMLKIWSFSLVFSILISVLIHILFEAPVSALIKLLMTPRRAPRHGQKEVQSGNSDSK